MEKADATRPLAEYAAEIESGPIVVTNHGQSQPTTIRHNHQAAINETSGAGGTVRRISTSASEKR